jgi:hypothetical protein
MELHDKTNRTQLKLHQKHPPYDDFFEARVWGKVILRSGYTIWKKLKQFGFYNQAGKRNRDGRYRFVLGR